MPTSAHEELKLPSSGPRPLAERWQALLAAIGWARLVG